MIIFQNFKPKQKLQLNANGGGLLACFQGPSTAPWLCPKDCSQGWHMGAELKDQDLLFRGEILTHSNNFTSSTEPAWSPGHNGQELCAFSRQNKCTATSQTDSNGIVPTYKPTSGLTSKRTPAGASRADKY